MRDHYLRVRRQYLPHGKGSLRELMIWKWEMSIVPRILFSLLQRSLGNSYPVRRTDQQRPDLLLYTLTDKDRYKGPVELLRNAIGHKKQLVFHGLSGAGKTRALLDMLANDEELPFAFLIYLDFASLSDGTVLTGKNFIQADVRSTKVALGEKKGNREWAGYVIRCLVLSRVALLTKLNYWSQQQKLLAQLGITEI